MPKGHKSRSGKAPSKARPPTSSPSSTSATSSRPSSPPSKPSSRAQDPAIPNQVSVSDTISGQGSIPVSGSTPIPPTSFTPISVALPAFNIPTLAPAQPSASGNATSTKEPPSVANSPAGTQNDTPMDSTPVDNITVKLAKRAHSELSEDPFDSSWDDGVWVTCSNQKKKKQPPVASTHSSEGASGTGLGRAPPSPGTNPPPTTGTAISASSRFQGPKGRDQGTQQRDHAARGQDSRSTVRGPPEHSRNSAPRHVDQRHRGSYAAVTGQRGNTPQEWLPHELRVYSTKELHQPLLQSAWGEVDRHIMDLVQNEILSLSTSNPEDLTLLATQTMFWHPQLRCGIIKCSTAKASHWFKEHVNRLPSVRAWSREERPPIVLETSIAQRFHHLPTADFLSLCFAFHPTIKHQKFDIISESLQGSHKKVLLRASPILGDYIQTRGGPNPERKVIQGFCCMIAFTSLGTQPTPTPLMSLAVQPEAPLTAVPAAEPPKAPNVPVSAPSAASDSATSSPEFPQALLVPPTTPLPSVLIVEDVAGGGATAP